MKRKIIFLLLASVIIQLNFSCDSVEPPVDNTKPGRRDYVWTIDTLDVPYSLVRRMWGSGPDDVWAILSGADLDKTIWHYDGITWTTDGVLRSINPASIFGFGSDNIWLGGHQGEIWHYDGSTWSQVTVLIATSGTTITWENIWGESVNDVYTVGAYEDHSLYNNNGVIAHYDGNLWKLLDINVNNSLTKIFRDNITGYIIEGMRFGLTDTSKVFLFNQSNLKEIYSNIANSTYEANIEKIGDRVLISWGSNIYTYSSNKFNLFYTVNNSSYTGGFRGRSLKDIFLGMLDGIAHYNGSDVQYLFHYNPNYIGTVSVILETEVFFPFYDLSNGKTYMYKGTLP